jgi:2-polyprenyl-3-methyl-5-hydroxy-6-metoxy-1,4-benzoquinol methylase
MAFAAIAPPLINAFLHGNVAHVAHLGIRMIWVATFGNAPPPMSLQQRFWNDWNASTREQSIDVVSTDQARVVTGWLNRLGRKDLDIIEVGCGAGWLCGDLRPFGRVTGTDLSDEVLTRAHARLPDVNFVAGDFLALDFPPGAFDVVVTLEVLSCVQDQEAFVAKIARLLKPGGYVMMATPNRRVLQRYNRIPPPGPGQLRRWTDKQELRSLLAREFDIREIFSITPRANKGLMRILNSRTFNRPIRALVGDRVDRFKEAIGLGWTLMALARKPV